MAIFSTVPMEDARRAVLPPRKATQEQYRQYVRQLSTDEAAGQLELGPDDKPITERARLKAAAKAEGVNLYIQRRGTTMVVSVQAPCQDAPQRVPCAPSLASAQPAEGGVEGAVEWREQRREHLSAGAPAGAARGHLPAEVHRKLTSRPGVSSPSSSTSHRAW
jgi:hypothetical protein